MIYFNYVSTVRVRQFIASAALLAACTWSPPASAGMVGTPGPYGVTVLPPVSFAAPTADTLIECRPSAPPGHFAGPLPAIMLIHGGAWRAGTNDVGPNASSVGRWCTLWASWGFNAFSVGYRLTTEAAWPAQIVDVQAAIRWVRAHAADLGINPGMIVVDGDSAGGQLAMIAGYADSIIPGDLAADNPTTFSRPELVISQFGPWSFGPSGNVSSRAADYAAQTLIDRADGRTTMTTPNTLFVQGTLDTTVNQCWESEAGYLFLTANHRPASYIAYAGGHEFTGIDPLAWAGIVGTIQMRTISFAYATAHYNHVIPSSEAGPGLTFTDASLPVGCP